MQNPPQYIKKYNEMITMSVHYIKFETETVTIHKYLTGYDIKPFYIEVKEHFLNKTFPISMKGKLELGTSGDLLGMKFNTSFTSFPEFFKWLQNQAHELNYEWIR